MRKCSILEEYFVFLDIDETLIRFKSMSVFMDYLLYEQCKLCLPDLKDRRLAFERLKRTSKDSSISRESLNVDYYHLFEGVSEVELDALADLWMRDKLGSDTVFISATFEACQRHRKKGARLILISGSFKALLTPIKENIHAEVLLCSRLEVINGFYTGNLSQQVIGKSKWTVISDYLRNKRVDLKSCYSYGDHDSDLCFMEKTGFPVVVGNNPILLERASQNGWQVLSSENLVA